ncbi:MAG: hypothetical protein ABR526_13180 [Chthoniobacterales bacterium]
MMRILTGTNATIVASNKQMDTASLARIALDRFGNDFAGAILDNGATALSYSDASASGNSAIAFACTSRARGPSGQPQPGTWETDTRGAFVGYKITPATQNIGGGTSQAIPSLNRGDGRLTCSVQAIASKASANFWDVFGTGNARIPNDLTVNPAANTAIPPTRPDEQVLNWQVIASGIFRLHISFALDDGTIVQTPPAYKNFFVNAGPGGCVPIAFSKATSADASQRFVKGLIVGIAGFDESTRNLSYGNDNNFWTTIGGQIVRPTAARQVPLTVWNQNLPNITFGPARQNLRTYQRFFSLTL